MGSIPIARSATPRARLYLHGCNSKEGALSGFDKLLAITIAGLLAAGIAVAGVRGSRGVEPRAAPTAPAQPTASVSPVESASPTVTATFSGLPPFVQTGTPSPSISPGERLPHTGEDGGLMPAAVLMLVLALGAAGLLVRSA